ncbi:MAG: cupin domain-containing protein [Firmicutes bacterium]|nr:cupin domain-containing protein [Bacillota bacterium]
MQITVRKPTDSEVIEMKKMPTWGCGISVFDWHYDSEERCLILEGEVTVNYGNGESASFSAGDFVIFPKGLSCVWKVSKAVQKHYVFI